MDALWFLKKKNDKLEEAEGVTSQQPKGLRKKWPMLKVAPELTKLVKVQIRKLPTMEWISAKSFWQDSPAVLARGVRLIGIGFEEVGWEEFLEQGFFSGELYLDTERVAYKALGMVNMGPVALWTVLCMPRFWNLMLQEDNVPYNQEGDAYQNGGCAVISEGGKQVLLLYKDHKPFCTYHTTNIAKVFGIEYPGEDETKA
ncbi:unnamed protein product [Allacma fusca]|uniref:Uncharacterized protein n=1 Tax=Allacma fusca TaxID=39272 RepID=A0A8J2K1N0_9HEXA|nr:unnamed protein product [Allacma fusca]